MIAAFDEQLEKLGRRVRRESYCTPPGTAHWSKARAFRGE
jgi:hypothetical protein